jgi:hypothetical protein
MFSLSKIGSYLFVVMFFALGIGSVYIAYDSYEFDKSCIGVVGELDSRYTKKCYGFWCSYTVSFSFEYEGNTYTGAESIDAEPVMKAVPVYFLPSNPKKNRIERGRIPMALMISALMFSLAGWSMRSIRKSS